MSSVPVENRTTAWLTAFPLVFFAFMWGSAEGAFFFIVPDVLLTYVAVRHDLRRALWCAFAAGLGSLEGSVIIYLWSLIRPEQLTMMLEQTPAVSIATIEAVYRQMHAAPIASLISAGYAGMAFKIYAAGAPHAGLALWLFMLIYFPVRLARFAAVTFAAAAICRALDGDVSKTAQLRFWLCFWLVVYVAYWMLAN